MSKLTIDIDSTTEYNIESIAWLISKQTKQCVVALQKYEDEYPPLDSKIKIMSQIEAVIYLNSIIGEDYEDVSMIKSKDDGHYEINCEGNNCQEIWVYNATDETMKSLGINEES